MLLKNIRKNFHIDEKNERKLLRFSQRRYIINVIQIKIGKGGNMGTKATINDVAEAANVSIATVSRVLNNSESVKESTKLRVQKAMAAVGYQNDFVKNELNEAGKMILVIMPEITNPFYANIIEGISATADFQGYDFVMYKQKEFNYSLEKLKALAEVLNVCGLILLGPGFETEVLRELDKVIPIVQCAEFAEDSELPYVSIDDYEASKIAVNYLLRNGRKKIALCNGPSTFKYARNREQGYIDALQEAGEPVDRSLIVNLPAVSYEPAVAVLSRMISGNERPDAIFAISDVLAAAAVKAVNRAGLKVPDDVAVVGFDDTYVALMCEPALTTVHQPAYQMGVLSCKMLIDRINHVQSSHEQLMMDVDLLVRGSA